MRTRLVHCYYSGFHGRTPLAFRVPADAAPGTLTTISDRVAHRLNNRCCGNSNCLCGEHVAESNDDRSPATIIVPHEEHTIRGFYHH